MARGCADHKDRRSRSRRVRVTLAAWCAGLGRFVTATTAISESSFSRGGDLVRETRMVDTNTGMRLLGLASGLSAGGYMLHREFVTLAALAALMSTFAVIRHARQDEELGRAEILGATAVGRYAGVAAGVLATDVADLVLALVLGAGIVVAGQPVGGALLAGASVAGVGLVGWRRRGDLPAVVHHRCGRSSRLAYPSKGTL